MKSIRRILISAIIFTITIFTLSSAFTIKTYASEGNGEASDDKNVGKANDHKTGHWTYGRSGYLVYLVDNTGAVYNNRVAFVSASKNVWPAGTNTTYLTTRYPNATQGLTYSIARPNAKWGYPFTSSGHGRGAEIKQWMTQAGTSGSNAYYVVEKYLGAEALEWYKDKPDQRYLVLDVVVWHRMFSGSLNGQWVAASASGMANLYNATGTSSGSASCDLRRMQICAYLDKKWDGLAIPPIDLKIENKTPAAILGYGYGEIAVRGDETIQGLVHTWNKEKYQTGTPGESETTPTGIFHIVKTYTDYNKTTKKYTSAGTFVVDKVAPNISIDDEPMYKLKGWGINSSTAPSGIPGNMSLDKWYTQVKAQGNNKISRKGTKPAIVTCLTAKNEYTVYVYLQRDTEKVIKVDTTNYTLPQSYVSRRIFISTPDSSTGSLSNAKHTVNDHIFKFTFAAHSTSCPGHKYYCKNNGTKTDCGGATPTYETDPVTGKTTTTVKYYTCPGHLAYCKYPGSIENGQGFYGKGDSDFEFTLADALATSYGKVKSFHATDTVVTNEVAGIDVSLPEAWKFVGQGTYRRTMDNLGSWIGNNYETKIDPVHAGYKHNDVTTIIHRGLDKLTIAEFKNAAPAALSGITDDGYFTAANHPLGTRKSVDYKATFNINVQAAGELNQYSTYYDVAEPARDDLGNDLCKGSDPCDNNIRYASLGSNLKITGISVDVKCYSGKGEYASDDKSETPYGGDGVHAVNRAETSDIQALASKYHLHLTGDVIDTGRTVTDGYSVGCYPYIRMSYAQQAPGVGYTLDNIKQGAHDVYVLGQYFRTFTPSSFAQVIWYKDDDNYNLNITSTQFSTHSQAYTDHPTSNDTAGVIPGGVTINADVEKGNRQIMFITTYQPYLEPGSDGYNQVKATGGDVNHYTEAYARANHEAYVESIVDALSQTNMWQYQSKGAAFTGSSGIDGDIFSNAIHVYLSRDGDECNLSACTDCKDRITSKDTKYYFKLNSDDSADSKSDRAAYDVEVLNDKPEEAECIFGTKVDGTIFGDGSVATDVDAYTNIKAKLKLGFELDANRNALITGDYSNDPYVAKGPEEYYNEAFDGIGYIRLTTAVAVGTNDPAIRTSILDTMLEPISTGVKDTNGVASADLFTRYYIDQWKTAPYSNKYNVNNVIGTFIGKNVWTNDLDRLFKSKKVYIPNVSSQDLH